jgi:hypothetical protein
MGDTFPPILGGRKNTIGERPGKCRIGETDNEIRK